MAYCKNCGSEISEFANNCPECGAPQEKKQAPAQSGSYGLDNPSFGWGLLAFCLPLVGIILYFVWQNERPRTASMMLKVALISIAISIVSTMFQGCMAASLG